MINIRSAEKEFDIDFHVVLHHLFLSHLSGSDKPETIWSTSFHWREATVLTVMSVSFSSRGTSWTLLFVLFVFTVETIRTIVGDIIWVHTLWIITFIFWNLLWFWVVLYVFHVLGKVHGSFFVNEDVLVLLKVKKDESCVFFSFHCWWSSSMFADCSCLESFWSGLTRHEIQGLDLEEHTNWHQEYWGNGDYNN